MPEDTIELELRTVNTSNAHNSDNHFSHHDLPDSSDNHPVSLSESSLPPVDGGWGAWCFVCPQLLGMEGCSDGSNA